MSTTAPIKASNSGPLGTVKERAGFGPTLLDWGRLNGRVGLPWQVSDPYAVWVSEIMLQQTQVETVKGYFARFMISFPTINVLASASEEEVLAVWAGLGYYRRAKFMHQAATQVMKTHGGNLPRTAAELSTLPGIGRSTAAAIASICHGEPVAIMDGNVARVLARHWAMKEDVGTSLGRNRLWLTAASVMDTRAPGLYTQSIMDLGATVCMPRAPKCDACPFESSCKARAAGDPTHFPIKTKSGTPKRLSNEIWRVWTDGSRIGLRKNTDLSGVWQSMVVFGFDDEALITATTSTLDVWHFEHAFSHYDLHANVELIAVSPDELDAQAYRADWLALSVCEAGHLPLPTPIKTALARIESILTKSSKALPGLTPKKET